MKSKPPNKKVKVEITTLGPPGTPENPNKSSTPSLSPAGSTSSTTSSLLSIGPPSYTLSIRPTPDGGGVPGIVAAGGAGPPTKGSNSKSKGAANSSNLADKSNANNAAAGGVGGVVGQVVALHPAYPTLTHYNLGDFPKISACISGSKGGIQNSVSSIAASVVGEGSLNKPIDSLTMEDIDTLQAELETLWSSVATRIRVLHREQSLLQTTPNAAAHHHNLTLEHFDPQHQEKIAAVATIIDHGTRTSVSAAAKLVMASQIPAGTSPVPSPSPGQATATPSGTTKRAATAKGERLPKKKLKGEAGGKSKKGGDKPAARATQNRSHSVSSDLGSEGFFKHHEAPYQFWESIDAYCREVTMDDIEQLSGIIDEQDKLGKNALDIPPLGKHFKSEAESKHKTKESRLNTSKDYVGPLTQRLVSALVEERVSMFSNQYNLNSPKEDASLASPQEGLFIHRQGLVSALGLDGGANTPPLESRIRECLVDQGLLLPDDANDPILLNPDDEVLAEIKRTQSVFKKLTQYNSEKLGSLFNTGKKAIDTYSQKRELEKADKDVLDAYKTIASCRLKKKPITKKEKDAATKALESRRKVLIKLGATSGTTTNGTGSSALLTSFSPVDPTGLLKVEV